MRLSESGQPIPLVWVGIDPGADGAVVLRCGPSVVVVRAREYYDGRGRVDGRLLRLILMEAHQRLSAAAESAVGAPAAIGHVVVEEYSVRKAKGKKAQGVASQCKAAANADRLIGVVEGLGWPASEGKTHTGKGGWRHYAGIRKRREDKGCIKRATIRTVKTALPHVDLRPGRCTTDQDGIADAAGMSLAAEALWRREVGNG